MKKTLVKEKNKTKNKITETKTENQEVKNENTETEKEETTAILTENNENIKDTSAVLSELNTPENSPENTEKAENQTENANKEKGKKGGFLVKFKKKEVETVPVKTDEEKENDIVKAESGKLILGENEYYKSNGTNSHKESEFSELYDLSELMNISIEDMKQDFIISQIRRVMTKLKKVMVRYNVAEKDLSEMLFMSNELNFGGIGIGPVTLDKCAKIVRKHKLEKVNVTSIIDFPFGESAFKSKLSDIKESIKVGVDEILVTMPLMMLTAENIKTFKKQVKKIGRMYKNESGILLNAGDMEEDKIKLAMKTVAKTKLSCVAFAFGETTLEDVKAKLNIVNKYKGKKKVYVVANVDSLVGFVELNKLSADLVMTPYADKIGKEIIERFNLKKENFA